MYYLKIVVYFFIYLFLIGCNLNYNKPRTILADKTENIYPSEIIEKEKKIIKPGPPPFSEKLEPITKNLKKDKQLYSLIFDNAQLNEILRAITKDIDLNVSVETLVDMSKTITVHLKNVTFEEALDLIIVKGANYFWKIDNGILYIKKFDEYVYHFDYLDLPGSTEIEVGGDMLASSIQGAGVKGAFSVANKRDSKNVDIWESIQKNLETFKSTDGILRINRSAGLIYIIDTPSKITSIVKYLDALKENLYRQVFIEAKILEVKLKDEYKLGIDWTKGVNIDFLVKSASEKEILPEKLSIGLGFGGTIARAETSNFNAILDFLQTQGDVTSISNPHISVMNGQTAVMTVGYQFPYGDISGASKDKEGIITYNASIKRVILGLQLGITTQISKDGTITLHVVPTVTQMMGTAAVDIPLDNKEKKAISNPIIDLQELATMVRVKEGNTIVLAGLISKLKELDNEKLPFLSKLPYLKNIFNHISEKKENRELVIFITPYIKNSL